MSWLKPRRARRAMPPVHESQFVSFNAFLKQVDRTHGEGAAADLIESLRINEERRRENGEQW